VVFTDIVIFIIFSILLIAISVCDIKKHMILKPTLWVGIAFYIINYTFTTLFYSNERPYNAPAQLKEFVICTFIFLIALILLSRSNKKSGIGFGDIKLAYVLFINFGYLQALRFIFVGGTALILKELICFIFRILEKSISDKESIDKERTGKYYFSKRIPLAPYLTFGFVISQILVLLNII